MRIFHGVLLGTALLASYPVEASWETVQERVNAADLDLSKPEDVAVLKKRVLKAAIRLCKRTRHYNLSAAHLPDRRCLRNARTSSTQPIWQHVVEPNAGSRTAK